MAHKIIIQSTKGRPDSLKHDVTIVFTFTPKQTSGAAYNVVTCAGTTFPSNSEMDQTLSWDRDLSFATYEVKNHAEKKKCQLKSDRGAPVTIGKCSHLTPQSGSWSEVEGCSAPGLASAVVYNYQVQHMALLKNITWRGIRETLPIGAWQPIGGPIRSSPELFLQAFVVEDPDSDGIILEAGQLKRPLFTDPLDCEALPASSAWMLTEDDDGVIALESTDIVETPKQRKETRSIEQTVETLTGSFGDMKKQLDTLAESLKNTRQRLLTVEATVSENQVELREARTSLATNRDEISRLGSKMPAVTRLVASFDHTDERLAAIEVSVNKAQEEVKNLAGGSSEIARLVASVQPTQKQTPAVDTASSAIVDHRIAAVESKTNDLVDESICHIQDQLSAARTAASTTRDRVDRLNRGILSVQATADTVKASVDQDQDRLSALEEGVGRAHQRLDAVEKNGGSIQDSAGAPRVAGVRRQSTGIRRPSSPAQDDSPVASNSLVMIRRQVLALDRKFPTMEAKVDRMGGLVAILERKLSTVEGKGIRVEKLAEGTQEEVAALQISVVTARDELSSLDSRLADVEVKVNDLAEPWDEEPPSPGVFPSQTQLNPRQ